MAVLDLGTNTFNLLIGTIEPELKQLFSSRTVVKLRKESIAGSALAEAAIDRGIRAIEGHLKVAQEWSCEKVVAVGTSGIRAAKNGERFVDRVHEATGIEVERIDGDREAELITEGVRATGALGQKPALILDIGGGSSEFIIADQDRTHWRKSYEIGVARLLKEVRPDEPIRPDQIERVREILWEKASSLEEALKEHEAPATLIGCSGSFESIAEMAEHRFPDANAVQTRTWVEVALSQYQAIHQDLLRSTLEERLKMTGLAEVRAEMIVLGSILIQEVLEKAGTKRLISSFYSLREGLLLELARTQGKF